MATTIQWTDETWNPLRGCTPVSPGCMNCYAMKVAHRFSGPGQPYEGLTRLTTKGPRWSGVVRTVPEMLAVPLKWRKPRRVFVNSMSDLFHEDVPFTFIDSVFAVMALCPQHTFQVLTKRPERMAEYVNGLAKSINPLESYARSIGRSFRFEFEGRQHSLLPFPLPNVWLGTSVEDQQRYEDRIPHLLRTPAAVRFLSVEPMLGPIYLDLPTDRDIHWVIVGGESGSGARPFNIVWAESIIEQCKRAGIACFVKQLGAHPYTKRRIGDGAFTDPCIRFRLSDRKGGDMTEWPEYLRVRQFPDGVCTA